MNSFQLTAQEKLNSQAILIIDKVGVIGEALSQELSKDYVVLLLSNRSIAKFNNRIYQIPFKGGIPKVPKNNYIKIFIVDDGNKVTKESSFSFIKNAKITGADVYFLGSIRNIDLKYSDEIIKTYERVKVLIFGDLFDNEILFDKNSSVTRFILEARKNKKIKVRGEGLSLNYPISFNDTIKLIIKAIYIKIPTKAILLFTQHPITDISLANTFKKIDPEIDVDFVSSKTIENLYFPKNIEYALAKYDLLKKLKEIDLSSSKESYVDYKISKNTFSFLKPILFFLLACLFILLLPLFSTYTYSFLGFTQINSAKKAVDNGDFEKALKKIDNAKTFFNFAKQTSGPLIYESQLVGLQDKTIPLTKNINSGINLSHASSNLLNGILFLQKAKTEEDLYNSINYFKNANIILQELKATNQFPKQMSVEFQNIIPIVEFISNSSDVIPSVLGFDSEKRYLVLFSNSLEIRPGGGVVDSVGLLKVKNGKIISFEIKNAKEIDDKLNVFISSPFFLRRHLPSDNYYLKDSLSNSDFVASSIDAANIYNISTGENVDGVIGLNSGFAKKVLSSPEIMFKIDNNRITGDNFYEYLESVEENEILKSKIYSDLISKLSSDISSRNKVPYFSFAQILGSAISEKDIMLAFKDTNIQSVFTVNDLSNTLIDDRKKEENTINDFFGISEANLSKESNNNFISRSISRTLGINNDKVLRSNVKITFNNNNESKNYKTYLQIILPKGSKIQKVSEGGRIENLIPAVVNPNIYESSSFKVPSGLEIEEVDQGDKTIFGMLVSVAPKAKRNVLISYTLPYKFVESQSFAKYSLFVYKQPGVESYPFEQSFNFQSDYKILPSDSVSMEIRKDEIFNFIISQEK